MNDKYVISIDQSTQGTKALIFDRKGNLLCRADRPHKQIINDQGWVSHDPEEIYQNTINVIRDVLVKSNVSPEQVECLGISNQRETSIIWDRDTGRSLDNAVVWQCARASEICERSQVKDQEDKIFARTGLRLSPYFPAAKICWLLENVPGAKEKAADHKICHGTVDSYLIYRLTGGKTYATDYSNASRTQLFDIMNLCWDRDICQLFGIDVTNMPEVMDSNACFGYTDCQGTFSREIPIHAAMGDSHAALFGQNCRKPGQAKATYGTGSSIMMNIGGKPVLSSNGLVTSLAWGMDGKVDYVLEGNLNYTGAVISWLKDDARMIDNPGETEELAKAANQNDSLYMIPAFSGLGAPYWNSHAKAAFIGMDRTTGRNELVRACLESIVYQITDVLKAMNEDAGSKLDMLKVDGGPTRNGYLMQFQSDITGSRVSVPNAEELSGIGAAYMAGIASGVWDQEIFNHMIYKDHNPQMDQQLAEVKYAGWKDAVSCVNK